MSEPILCKICGKRRARRACPAVHGDICTLCCGAEREVSLNCPLECVYLQDAHRHEKPAPVSADQIPYKDIEVTEEFLNSHDELVAFCAFSLVQAALETQGAIDTDVVVALDAIIQTYRTLQSGLIYETRPENTVAAAVQRAFTASLDDYQKTVAERQGLVGAGPRTSEILTALVFLHRLGLQSQNGRPRGRMFIGLLKEFTPASLMEERVPSIVL